MIAVALRGRLVIPLPDGSTDIEVRIRRQGRGLTRSSSLDVAVRCISPGHGEYHLCGELPDRGRAYLCEEFGTPTWWDEGYPRPVESRSESRMFGRGQTAGITTKRQWASWEVDRCLCHLRWPPSEIPAWLWELAERARPAPRSPYAHPSVEAT